MQNLSFPFFTFLSRFLASTSPTLISWKNFVVVISAFLATLEWIHIYKKGIHLAEQKVKNVFSLSITCSLNPTEQTECQAFSHVVRIGTPPPPYPQASVFHLLRFAGGGVHAHLRERGWGCPNSNEGTDTVVLYLYMYLFCVESHLVLKIEALNLQIVFERHCFAFLLMFVHIMKETPDNVCTKTQVKKFRTRCKKR